MVMSGHRRWWTRAVRARVTAETSGGKGSRARRGLSLVELLVYLAIVSVVVVIAVVMSVNLLGGRAKTSSFEAVNQNARLALDRMTSAVRSAEYVDVAQTVFGNLGGRLVLQMPNPLANPTALDVSGGVLRIAEGNGAPVPLTSADLEVTGFTITRLNSTGSEGVRLVLALRRRNPQGAAAFDADRVVETSVIPRGCLAQFPSAMNTGANPWSIAVSGNHAYVTSGSDLHIFDIAKPACAIEKSVLSLGGTQLRSVAVSGNFAYVVNESLRRLQVVDVSAPASPRLVGWWNQPAGRPGHAAVSGRYSYVVGPTIGGERLYVVDVSNPTIQGPMPFWTATQGAQHDAVFATSRAVFAVSTLLDTLNIFDNTNPTPPVLLGSRCPTGPGGGCGLPSEHGPGSLAVTGDYALVVNRVSDTLQAYSRAQTAPDQLLAGPSVSTGDEPVFVTTSGDRAYVANWGDDTMKIFDISNLTAPPPLLATLTTGDQPNGIAVSGRYAYVVNYGSGNVQVFDVSAY